MIPEEYFKKVKAPLWLEYNTIITALELKEEELRIMRWLELPNTLNKDWAKESLDYFIKERKKIIAEQEEKLEQFCNLLITTDKDPWEIEKEIYGSKKDFYSILEELNKDEESEEAEEQEDEETGEECNLYLEKDLTADERDRLFAEGFKRLKISPFGRSGATYYWVDPRYNESKEHAFFCYLIEAEVRKHIQEVKLNTSNGPDIEFEHDGKTYCFDVETGKNLERHKQFLFHKFTRYKLDYDESYILVTKKSLKKKYRKYGKVITRAQIKEIIKTIFA